MSHDILVEAADLRDLAAVLVVVSTDGLPVPISVWSQACNIAASTLTSSTATTPADHINIDLDLLVTLRNTDPTPECALTSDCDVQSISFNFEFEDFASTVATFGIPTMETSATIVINYSLVLPIQMCYAIFTSPQADVTYVQHSAAQEITLNFSV